MSSDGEHGSGDAVVGGGGGLEVGGAGSERHEQGAPDPGAGAADGGSPAGTAPGVPPAPPGATGPGSRLFRPEALRHYAEKRTGSEELRLADRRVVRWLWVTAAVIIGAVGLILASIWDQVVTP